ncbi:DUF58 domain-containing protein [Isosphaeraceae bacterium EP7]
MARLAAWWKRRRKLDEMAPSTRNEFPSQAAALLRQVRRLRFRARPGDLAQLSGAYLGSRPGSGLTFSELKPYEPGDDVRHLDWNVTARQGRPYVRSYIEERALTLWIVADISASLGFGPPRARKADRAMQCAALLATAALRNQDRVGLLLVGDRIEHELPPGGGVPHLSRLLRLLVLAPCSGQKTNLNAAIERLARLERRSLIVVLSDFLDLPDPIAWGKIASRHQVRALRFVAPLEREIPQTGLLSVTDAESGASIVRDTASTRASARYSHGATQRQTAFTRWCRSSGVLGTEVDTRHEPLVALLRLFRNLP